MAQFLVLADSKPGGWRVGAEALTTAIRAQWTAVEIDSMHRSAAQSFRWSFETESGPGEAYLHEDGTCLYLDVWRADAAQLAIVFRRLAPADLDVVFCEMIAASKLRARLVAAVRSWPSKQAAWLRPVGVQRGTRVRGRSAHAPSWRGCRRLRFGLGASKVPAVRRARRSYGPSLSRPRTLDSGQ